jgi:hypothetical protein
MSEVNETASAAAEPEQATNMSPSEFANRRANELTQEVEEQPEQTEVEETEETYNQEAEVSAEEATEEVETEEEGSVHVEEGEQDVLSQIELDDMTDEELRELSDKLGSRAVARFGELTAKRKAAEAEVERLRSEMGNKLQSEVKESENPYNNIDSIEKLQSVQQEIENVVEWAEDLIFDSDGYGPDDILTEVDGKELTKSEVRKHLQNARKADKKYIPAQLKTIEKRNSALSARKTLQDQATKELSWMNKENEVSDKYKQMLDDPRLKDLDKFDAEIAAQLPYLLAHAANSMYARQPIENTQGNRSSRLKPPSGTPGSAKTEKTISKGLKNLQSASNQFKGSGRKDDFIKMRTLQLTR